MGIATNKGADRQGRDFYPTPRKAFAPLIPYLPKTGLIWEPAWGDGRLVQWMRAAGREAAGDDLARGYDFLLDEQKRDCIVTNPPFSLGLQFSQHAVALAAEVFLLLPLSALGGQYRRAWYQAHEPSALFPLAERPAFAMGCRCACGHKWMLALESARPKACPSCGAGGVKVSTTDAMEYAWFYWGPRHRGIIHL